MSWTTRSNCFTAARERGEEAMSLGSKAKWVACKGMSRSSWGRSHTTQQRPKRASYVIATSGNVCPQRGCRGSRTVMVCSGDTLCPRGVVPWLRFPQAYPPEQDEVGFGLDKLEMEVMLHLEAVNLGGPVLGCLKTPSSEHFWGFREQRNRKPG